jgi:hypothetical protein
MIHRKGFPLFPRKAVFDITMTPDSATASVSFTARQYVAGAETADCARSTVGQECLSADEVAALYGILAKLFESQESQAQLGSDEYVPPAEVTEEADA